MSGFAGTARRGRRPRAADAALPRARAGRPARSETGYGKAFGKPLVNDRPYPFALFSSYARISSRRLEDNPGFNWGFSVLDTRQFQAHPSIICLRRPGTTVSQRPPEERSPAPFSGRPPHRPAQRPSAVPSARAPKPPQGLRRRSRANAGPCAGENRCRTHDRAGADRRRVRRPSDPPIAGRSRRVSRPRGTFGPRGARRPEAALRPGIAPLDAAAHPRIGSI